MCIIIGIIVLLIVIIVPSGKCAERALGVHADCWDRRLTSSSDLRQEPLDQRRHANIRGSAHDVSRSGTISAERT